MKEPGRFSVPPCYRSFEAEGIPVFFDYIKISFQSTHLVWRISLKLKSAVAMQCVRYNIELIIGRIGHEGGHSNKLATKCESAIHGVTGIKNGIVDKQRSKGPASIQERIS